MLEFFLLGCTGVVVFLHSANFFFHALSSHLAIRAIRLFFALLCFFFCNNRRV
ncbi:hypothetical protein PHJA_002271100 [Phtheirospermum japonicum]|uniref:Uncharacterized protein n=1 Tax=Phtheirospermum japonicum TaxID=374723 RepID=A0A830D4F1_9LAMI|nr:hypothetical protein PHJA_002271100 [Phtheirospermum japonicum]